jgi:hypothetical protein
VAGLTRLGLAKLALGEHRLPELGLGKLVLALRTMAEPVLARVVRPRPAMLALSPAVVLAGESCRIETPCFGTDLRLATA